jgi:hypothetical protein
MSDPYACILIQPKRLGASNPYEVVLEVSVSSRGYSYNINHICRKCVIRHVAEKAAED